MGVISVSLPSDGSTADVADVNTPITTIVNAINGNLDNNNIKTNAAIDASKIANITASQITNSSKFSVYRAAALTSSTTATAVAFDTKTFDTGSNVDIVTNKGRFTAPVAGFYHFDAHVGLTAANNTAVFAYLYKNGAVAKIGSGDTSSTAIRSIVSGVLQLAANDYVEVYFIGGAGSTIDVGLAQCYFDGFLVSGN